MGLARCALAVLGRDTGADHRVVALDPSVVRDLLDRLRRAVARHRSAHGGADG